jgi:hypothetical protein
MISRTVGLPATATTPHSPPPHTHPRTPPRPSPPQGYVSAQAVFRGGGASGAPVAATAYVDCVPPSMAGMRLRAVSPPAQTSVGLYWTGSPSAYGAALAGYKLAYKPKKPGGAAPLYCKANPSKGVMVVAVPPSVGTQGSPFVVTGLSAATQYSFRLCAVDTANNTAGGITTSVTTAA